VVLKVSEGFNFFWLKVSEGFNFFRFTHFLIPPAPFHNWFKAFDREVFSTELPRLDAYIQQIAEQRGIADYIRTLQEPTVWFQLPEVAMRLTSPEELQGLVSLPNQRFRSLPESTPPLLGIVRKYVAGAHLG
jgi:hypothetical protein